MSIAILIAEDHRVVLDGLHLLLESKQDIKVVGKAVNGREAVQKAKNLKPDIVVMDISMPELNGIEAARQIREFLSSIRIIILSIHSTSEHITRALRVGASGYLLKESTSQELIEAIRIVHAGRRYLSPKISGTLIDKYLDDLDSGSLEDPLERLSPREREIIQLVVEGKSSAEIADLIYLSPKTIETYRSRLMQKLGVKNVVDLIKFAIGAGLIPIK
jgi:RNA polymerase sigma factor (sigma-70 family)